LPGRWLRERRKDHYYRMAKRRGLRSRAAYKLMQIQKKYHLISPGDVVVDLGAAPGGWLQVARDIVGGAGFTLGVDIKEIRPLGWENVKTLQLDINDEDAAVKILEALPREADVLLSDVAPSLSGVWELDHARQIDLARKSLEIASKVLRPGGHALIKVFQGEFLEEFLKDVKTLFSRVRLVKPKASRSRSAEIYVVAMGFRGNPL